MQSGRRKDPLIHTYVYADQETSISTTLSFVRGSFHYSSLFFCPCLWRGVIYFMISECLHSCFLFCVSDWTLFFQGLLTGDVCYPETFLKSLFMLKAQGPRHLPSGRSPPHPGWLLLPAAAPPQPSGPQVSPPGCLTASPNVTLCFLAHADFIRDADT